MSEPSVWIALWPFLSTCAITALVSTIIQASLERILDWVYAVMSRMGAAEPLDRIVIRENVPYNPEEAKHMRL
jgi:hypothetical protein